MEGWRLMFDDTPIKWMLVETKSVQQNDNHSCGIFATLNGQLLLRNEPLDMIDPNDIDLYRKCMKDQLNGDN